jgi:tetratricopeptide (TPR) repeat protein
MENKDQPINFNTHTHIVGYKQQRAEAAQSLKTRGNAKFSGKSYEEAAELYTKALLFKADPIFYSNRAACYANLGFNDRVIEDCNEALALDPIYVDLENALYGNYHSYSVLYSVCFNAAL